MKIRMKTTMAGPAGNLSAGAVGEVDDVMGQQLVAGGYAERLDAPGAPAKQQVAVSPVPAPESASVEAPEAAVSRPRGKTPARREVKEEKPRKRK